MSAAFIEHRPLATDPQATTNHHAVIVGGAEVKQVKTQADGVEWARKQGYSPIHVARERHLQDRDVPAHWRKY
jgi:hypothetical protein